MSPDQVFNPRPDGTDAPVAGHYSVDRRGKVGLPMRLWFGIPEDLDRAPRWQMRVGDRHVDPADEEWSEIWPQAAKSPISRSEYDYRMERVAYAKEHGAASDPWAHRRGKIDLLTAPIPE